MLEKFYIACNAENHWTLTDRAHADDKIIFLKDEYDKFWQKILRGENFALPRYGDGERFLMIGREVKAKKAGVLRGRVLHFSKRSKKILQSWSATLF